MSVTKSCHLLILAIPYLSFYLHCMDDPTHLFNDKTSYLSMLPIDLQKIVLKRIIRDELLPILLRHAPLQIESQKKRVKYIQVKGTVSQLEPEPLLHKQQGNSVTIFSSDCVPMATITLPSTDHIISVSIEYGCVIITSAKYCLLHDLNSGKQIVNRAQLKISPDKTKYIEALSDKPIRIYDFATTSLLFELTMDRQSYTYRSIKFIDESHIKALYHYVKVDPGFGGKYDVFKTREWNVSSLIAWEKKLYALSHTTQFKLYGLLQFIKRNPKPVNKEQLKKIIERLEISEVSLPEIDCITHALCAMRYER